MKKDMDTTPFIGKLLLQICVGLNQIIFHFDGLSITVESNLVYRHEARKILIDSYPYKSSCLMNLIGQEIIEVIIKDARTLVLIFSGKEEMEIIASNELSESFQVTGVGIDIVV